MALTAWMRLRPLAALWPSRFEPVRISHYELNPSDFGLPTATLEELRGGNPAENAAITKAILEGETGPKRDIVLVNASAALVTANRAADFKGGVALAAESIDSGAARRKAAELAAFTQRS